MKSRIFLTAIMVFSIGAVTLALQSVRAPLLDLLIAIPLVFFFPGYSLTRALFPGKILTTAEHVLFGLGLSLVLAIIGGLVLNLTPAGLTRTSWIVLLSGVSLLACAFALFWEEKKREPEDGSNPFIFFSLRSILLFLCAILIVIGSLWYSNYEVNHNNPSPFTQLWALEDKNDPSIIHIGVQSEEIETLQYYLQVFLGEEMLQEPVMVTLKPQEKWEMTIQLTKVDAATREDIRVELTRLDRPDSIYRHVVLRRVN